MNMKTILRDKIKVCNRRCQRGFTVVYVTNRAYVDVRLGPFKFFLGHDGFLFNNERCPWVWFNVCMLSRVL